MFINLWKLIPLIFSQECSQILIFFIFVDRWIRVKKPLLSAMQLNKGSLERDLMNQHTSHQCMILLSGTLEMTSSLYWSCHLSSLLSLQSFWPSSCFVFVKEGRSCLQTCQPKYHHSHLSVNISCKGKISPNFQRLMGMPLVNSCVQIKLSNIFPWVVVSLYNY